MKNMLVGILISAFVLISFISCLVFAEEAVLTVRAHNAVILFLNGDVKVKQAALDEWIEASEGMALYPGDTVKTGLGSWVEIGVGSNQANVMKIKESTILELTELAPVKINLLSGELRALVEKLDQDEIFEVKTPMSVCGVRGTGWDTNTDGNQVVTDVYEGDVYFAAVLPESGTMEDPIINAGKRGVLIDPAKPITIEDVPLDRMMDWKKWKEDFLERRSAKEGGLQEKVRGIDENLDTSEERSKGKEGVFEKRDQIIMDNRTSVSDSSGS